MATEQLQTGQSAELTVTVTKEMTTNRVGRAGADVLSTPALLGLMEYACIEATDHLLADGVTTVGYAVDGMRHIAPTALGETVILTAELVEIEGDRLTYNIEAVEGEKKIGVATHRRAVIPT